MPKYQYHLSNGKFLTLEGDTPPSDEEVEGIAKQQNVQLVHDKASSDGTTKQVDPLESAKQYLSDSPKQDTSNPEKAEPEPGFLSRAWKTLSSPLTDLPSKTANYLADKIDEPKLDQSPAVASMKGFLAGATKGAGDLVSGFTSPLNLGLTATGLAEASPVLESIQPLMASARRLLSAPVAAHGVGQVVTSPTAGGKLMGGLEAILGGSGMLHGGPISEPELQPISNTNRLAQQLSEKQITPELPPEFVHQGAESDYNAHRQQTPVNPEDRLLELVKQKQGMGLPLPEDSTDSNTVTTQENKPSATFKGLQETGDPDNPTMPLFDVVGGPNHGSTVGADRLSDLGIDVPEVPKDAKLEDYKSAYKPNPNDSQAVRIAKMKEYANSQSSDDVNNIFNSSSSRSAINLGGAKADDIFPRETADDSIKSDRTANPDKPKYRLDSESGAFIPIDLDGNQIGAAVIPGKSLPAELMSSSKYKAALPEDKTSMLQKIYDTPRGLMSIDLPFVTSASFRQASPYVGTKDWFKAFVPAAKSYGSKEAYNAIHESIEAHPDFDLARSSGLAQTDLGKYSNREEQFRSELAEKIPGYGKVVQASNRAYTSYLNSLRFNRFTQLIDSARKEGLDPDRNTVVSKQIADAINTLTGRGKLATGIGNHEVNLESATKLLSNTFFSPRKIASEIQMLNPNTYVMTNPIARKELVSGLIRRVGTWMSIAGLAKTAGAQVSFNPTNPDFGKIKIGNTRFDPPGGLQQYLVLAAQTVMGGKTSSETGKFNQFGKGYKPETAASNAGNFIQNRLHPTAKFIADSFAGTQKTPFHMGDEAIKMVTPMFLSDITEAAKDDPSLLQILGVTAASGSGIGTQTYKKGSFGKPTFLPEQYDLNVGQK